MSHYWYIGMKKSEKAFQDRTVGVGCEGWVGVFHMDGVRVCRKIDEPVYKIFFHPQ